MVSGTRGSYFVAWISQRLVWSQMACVTWSVMSSFFVNPWTVAHQAPLSMEFSRQECWSGLPSPGNLPNPGIKPGPPALPADSLLSESLGSPTPALKAAS